MHPEYNFLSDKNRRDQASRVHKNNVVMDTECREHLHLSPSIIYHLSSIVVLSQIMEIITEILFLTKILYPMRLLLKTFQMKT